MSDGPKAQTFPTHSPSSSADRQLELAALAWVAHNRSARGLGVGANTDFSGVPPGAADPTRGATRFHRHDEAPVWARHLLPTALIGAYLFFAD